MRKDLICWDSSVLISWIRGDESQDRIQAARAVVESVESGSYKLVVSTLLYVEILESTMPHHAIERFKKFMQNRQVVEIIAVDIRVAEKAQSIRNKSQKRYTCLMPFISQRQLSAGRNFSTHLTMDCYSLAGRVKWKVLP